MENNVDMAKVGKTIAALRKKQNLTQSALAEKLFVSDKAVSRWETGEGLPEILNLMELSKIFNVSIEYILKGENVAKAQDFESEKPETKIEKSTDTNNQEQKNAETIMQNAVIPANISNDTKVEVATNISNKSKTEVATQTSNADLKQINENSQKDDSQNKEKVETAKQEIKNEVAESKVNLPKDTNAKKVDNEVTGKIIASYVLAGIAFISNLIFLSIFGLILSIIGLVLSKGKNQNKDARKIARITNTVALIISILETIIIVAFGSVFFVPFFRVFNN